MKRARMQGPVGPTVTGIDVSKWQGPIDWALVTKDPQNIRFAMVRTGDGKDPDPFCAANVRGALDAGLFVGGYHYVRGAHTALRQVNVALEALDGLHDLLQLGVAPDVEDGSWKPLRSEHSDLVNTPATRDVLRAAEAMAEAFDSPFLYTGQAWHWRVGQKGQTPAWAKKLGLWVPSYVGQPRKPSARPFLPLEQDGTPTWSRPAVWQHTASGRVDGVRGNVDLNVFLGTEEDLVAVADRPCR